MNEILLNYKSSFLDIDSSETFYQYYHDGLGSIMDIHERGDYKNLYLYDDFGKFLKKSEDVLNSYFYTGQEYDTLPSRMYNLRARYYDAGIGRFTQEDPVFNVDHMIKNSCFVYNEKFKEFIKYDPRNSNKYIYCRNNPLFYTDITGEWCGPGKIGDFFVRDKFHGCDFSDACKNHDLCYSVCHNASDAWKAFCDENFLNDMMREVNQSSWFWQQGCAILARIYHRAVRSNLGSEAYNDAQKEACKCK